MKHNLISFVVVCYLVAAVLFGIGIYKKTVYDGSSYHPKNAYVGGDAYNFIINSNYTTGYYVLSIGFFISGTLLLCTDMILEQMKDNPKKGDKTSNVPEYSPIVQDEPKSNNTSEDTKSNKTIIEEVSKLNSAKEILKHIEASNISNKDELVTKISELAKKEDSLFSGNQKYAALRLIEENK